MSLSQEKLSEILEISSKHLSNIENGFAKFSLPTLISIANALEVTPDFLMTDVIYKNEEYIKTEIAQYTNRFNRQQLYLIAEMCKTVDNLNKFPVQE